MSLYIKVLGTVTLLFASLLVILYLAAQTILRVSFEELELRDINAQMDRAYAVFKSEEDRLSGQASSWGVWDETYNFMQGNIPDYVENNLFTNALVDISVEFVVLLDVHNQIVFARSVDVEQAVDVNTLEGLEQSLIENIARISDLAGTTEVRSGYLTYGNGEIAVAAIQPILRNDRSGPSAGTIVMGRYIDAVERRSYFEEFHLPIDLIPIVSESDSSTVSDVRQGFPQPGIRTDNPDYAYANGLLLDFAGNPAVMFNLSVPRTVYQQGQLAFSAFLASLLVVAIGVCVGVLIILDRSVLRPLAGLLANVREIERRGSVTERVDVNRNDELGALALSINRMLTSLEHAQKQAVEMSLLRLKEIEESSKWEWRFFQNASHEFRTPLAKLNTTLYLLKKAPDRLPRYLTDLEQTIIHMSALVEDLFEVARVSSYEFSLWQSPVCVQDILCEMAAVRNATSGTREDTSTYPSEKVYVNADRARLGQSLNRLFQFFRNWGEGNLPTTRLVVDAEAHLVTIQIFCGDSSLKNLNPEDVFKPFAYPSEGGVAGTGLNVVLAQTIINKHGGVVFYEIVDRGVQFVIHLPIAAAPPVRSGETFQTQVTCV